MSNPFMEFWSDFMRDGYFDEVEQYRREEAREEAWRDGFIGEGEDDGVG